MATPPGYRWHIGQLTTGRIWRTFEVSAGSWSTSFAYGNPGAIDFTVPLRALNPDGAALDWPTVRADTAPPKAFAAVSYVNKDGAETFLEAGPIWKRKWSRKSGNLEIGAGGLSTYFDHRKALPYSAPNWAEWEVTYTGNQLGLIAKRYIELVQYTEAEIGLVEGPTTEWMSLPIVLPDDADLGGAGSAHTRSLQGYELAWMGTRLHQITEVIDGPEIQFVPRRRADDPRFLEWVARIGVEDDDFMLTQDGQEHVFDTTVPESPVRDMEVSEDATEFAGYVWAGGEGEAQGRPIAVGAHPDGLALLENGYPLLEGEITDTDSVSIISTLQAHVDEGAKQASRPHEQWTLKVSREGAPDVGQYRSGDWAEVRIGDDNEWLPADTYPARILALSGSAGSDEVDITLAERLSLV